MQRSLAALIVAAAPVLAVADDAGVLGVQGASDAEVEAIRQVIVTQSDSLTKGDIEAYASYWTEAAVMMPVNHPRIVGRQDIVSFVTGKFPPGTSTEFSDWDVAARDDLAVVTNTASIDSDSSAGGTQQFDQIVVLRRQADGDWRVQAWIWNLPD